MIVDFFSPLTELGFFFLFTWFENVLT